MITPSFDSYSLRFVRVFVAAFAAFFFVPSGPAPAMTVAEDGKAATVILVQPGASASERHAAEELADALKKITGAAIPVKEGSEAPDSAMIIGPGSAAEAAFPEIDLSKFGVEQIVIQSKGDRILLAGGRPRGTLYAVYQFLQRHCGVRWWTPWASHYPSQSTLKFADLHEVMQPDFEYRDVYWYNAWDADWAARNFVNGLGPHLDEKRGGKTEYAEFVHTYFPLVPPEEHFKDHPEWYSFCRDRQGAGKRIFERAQLCTTNPELRRFLLEQIREKARQAPPGAILSVSQNDWYNPCECASCQALDDAEESHAGTVLDLANFIAEHTEKEFPELVIDTLAYQYSRKAPKTLKARPNVVVRLCSIECDFARPLTDPVNAAFAVDIQDWEKRCNRLYVWDYTTDFKHYTMPFPNYFVLGDNVRFFRDHSVKGVFEQGAYQSHGAEFAELRAWLLAQLLWQPDQDDRRLIREFLEGYYGKASAGPIEEYLELMAKNTGDFEMTCFARPDKAPFLTYPVLSRAEQLWQKALEGAAHDPELLWRVKQAHQPVRYAALLRWSALQRECELAGSQWVFPATREAAANEWLSVVSGPGPKGWTPLSHLNERGLTPKEFVAGLEREP